jgi:hypothetical protein
MQNADVFYGLTWHGTILTRDQLGMPFRHESLAGGSLAGRVPPNAARFTLHCTSAGPNIGVTARLLPGVPAAEAPETADQPGFAVLPTGTGRAVFLHLGKNFLAAAQTCGPLHAAATPGEFSVFVLVPEQELSHLLFIRDNQWMTSTGALIQHGETGFCPGFIFRFGAIESDLRFGPCFTSTAAAPEASGSCLTEITVLRDGWKIAGQLRLFRPLIYYAAFGRPAIFEQLRCSLHSLAEFGAYTGDIHVISDRPKAYIAQFVPPALVNRLTVQHVSGMDFWDFALARLRLEQWPEAAQFQPLLYMDADIVFDLAVEPLLKDIARGGNICVASEPFSKLRDADCAGAPLFKAAGIDTGEKCGFNSGCQGFPSLAAARRYFSLTLHIAESYRAFHPGGVSKFADQPFANYVAYTTQAMNTELMDAAMRLSGPALSAAPANRRGMVHFWPSFKPEKKRSDMQAYIQALTAADTVAQAAAPEPALAAE